MVFLRYTPGGQVRQSLICLLVTLLVSCHIEIPQEPLADFTVQNDKCTAPCEMSFINNSKNAGTYTWDFGDGTSSTDQNPMHKFLGGSTYQVKLVAKGDGGSNGTAKTVSTVAPPGVNAAFTIVNNNCTAPCTVNFTNQSSNASSYFWDFNDGTSSTQTNPSKEYRSAGSFQVKLSASGPGGSHTSQPQTVTIQSAVEKAPTKVWDSTIGGGDLDICQTLVSHSDGGYFAFGLSKSNTGFEKSENSRGGFDYWLVKLNANGKKVWDKTFGGSSDDIAFTVVPTSDGGALMAGFSSSNRSGDKSENSKGKDDIWLVKVNSNGGKEWDRTIGGSEDDVNPRIIATPSDNGFLILVESNSNQSGDKSENSRGERDYWLVKLNADGSKKWDKTIGGNKNEFPRSALATTDGGYLVYGESLSDQSGEKGSNSKGSRDYWLVKVNANGAKQWDRSYGGNIDENGSSLVATTDGGFILSGDSGSGASGDKSENSRGKRDYWVVKVNASGDKQWEKTLGGNDEDFAGVVLAAPNGACIVTGFSHSGRSGDKTGESKGGRDSWIVKLSAKGEVVWDLTLGGSDSETIGTGTATADGGVTLAGFSNSPPSGDKSESPRGDHDFWIIKVK